MMVTAAPAMEVTTRGLPPYVISLFPGPEYTPVPAQAWLAEWQKGVNDAELAVGFTVIGSMAELTEHASFCTKWP